MFPEGTALPLAVAAVFSVAILIYVLSLRNPKITTVVVGPLFLCLVGAIIGAAQLHFMGSAVLSVCVVSFVFSRLSLRGLEVARSATSPVSVGDAVEIRIEVTNRDRLPKLFLRVRCPLPGILRAEQDTVIVPGLWPGRTVVVKVAAQAIRRGCRVLPPLEAIGGDPLDLFQTRAFLSAPVEVVVRPAPDASPSLDLLGDDYLGTVAPRRRVRPGQSLDFRSLREWRPGEDVRAIDWKATARLGRLVAVEFEPMQVGDLVVLIDNRAAVQVGDEEHSTLERAVSLAAGAILTLLEARGTASLRYLTPDGPKEATARAGDEAALLDELARVEPSEGRLEDLALDDVRGRTLLLVTPGTGPEVSGLVHQVTSAGGRAAVLLLDAPAFRRAPEASRPLAATSRWQRQLLALLGFGPDDWDGPQRAGGAADVPTSASGPQPPWAMADPAVEACAGALRDAGGDVTLVGPGGMVRQPSVKGV